MKYIFHPGEDLIPKAIYNAQMREPCEEIKPFWEGAILRDLENPDPKFCWRNFLMQFVP